MSRCQIVKSEPNRERRNRGRAVNQSEDDHIDRSSSAEAHRAVQDGIEDPTVASGDDSRVLQLVRRKTETSSGHNLAEHEHRNRHEELAVGEEITDKRHLDATTPHDSPGSIPSEARDDVLMTHS